MADSETMLIRVSGTDRPGITSMLMDLLSDAGAEIADVEQVVVRRHLVLGVVAAIPADRNLHEALMSFADEHHLEVEFDPVDTTPTERQLGVVVTLLAPSVTPRQIGSVATSIAAVGGNIDRIVRLARYPAVAYELSVLGAPIEQLRPALVAVSRAEGLDIALQPAGLGQRAQRLVVLDVDSTLIQDEVIDLLAEEAGCLDAVRALTLDAMNGAVDFESALRARVTLLAGLDTAALERARDRVRLTPGARTFVRTLRRLGFKIAIVSGGFTFFTEHLRHELNLDHAFANELEIRDGVLTGRVVGPIVDRNRKAELLAQVAELEGIAPDQTVAVGDGANDLDMLAAAGLGIAFNAKPVVRRAVDTAVNVPYLDAILFLLGVRRSEVEAADIADGLVPDATSLT